MATAALIIGGSALAGGIMSGIGARSQNALSRRQLRYQARGARLLRPQKILSTATMLQPAIREQILAALGPQFQQSVASNLARRGLTGTGIGTALQNAAIMAPGVTAATSALDRAVQMRTAQASALIGVGQSVQPQVNPMAAALTGGLSSGLTAFLVSQQLGQQGQTNPLMPTSGPTPGETGSRFM